MEQWNPESRARNLKQIGNTKSRFELKLPTFSADLDIEFCFGFRDLGFGIPVDYVFSVLKAYLPPMFDPTQYQLLDFGEDGGWSVLGRWCSIGRAPPPNRSGRPRHGFGPRPTRGSSGLKPNRASGLCAAIHPGNGRSPMAA